MIKISGVHTQNNYIWWQMSCWPWSVALQVLCSLGIWEITLPFLGTTGIVSQGFSALSLCSELSSVSGKQRTDSNAPFLHNLLDPKFDRLTDSSVTVQGLPIDLGLCPNLGRTQFSPYYFFKCLSMFLECVPRVVIWTKAK